MAIRLVRNGGNPRFALGRVFSLPEVGQLRALLTEAGAPASVEVDFSATAEVHPVALATLVELAREGGITLRTIGLGEAHHRLLAYLGSTAAAEVRREAERGRDEPSR